MKELDLGQAYLWLEVSKDFLNLSHCFFDQFFWGGRIRALGVGPKPIPHRHLSAKRLATAITLAANDQATRQRAYQLGQKIRAENGIANAIEMIQRYARR